MAHPPIVTNVDNSDLMADICDRLIYLDENPILGECMAALPRPVPMTPEGIDDQ
jgi:hypothetical protein